MLLALVSRQLVSLLETKFTLCELTTEILNIIQMNFILQRFNGARFNMSEPP
jgi:hypothetical protein